MRSLVVSMASAVLVFASAVSFAGGPNDGSEIGVGVGSIFQGQDGGNDNTQDAAIGFVDSSVTNAKVMVMAGGIAQGQKGGHDNVQRANIGVICDCTPSGAPKH